MIVKCRRLISYMTKEELDFCSWLTLDKEYVVLELEVDPKSGINIIIHTDDDNEPGRTYLDGFEIVSQHMPSNWAPKMDENGIYYLMPKSWMYEEFFEEVEDEKPHAVELFKKEATIIYQEEGWEYE
jgi:hypothetical protein